MPIVFKIRDKETGKFSKGGAFTYNIWTKEGKTWTNIGHVKNHLNQFMYNGVLRSDYPYHNAEIIEVEINYDDCCTTDVNTLVDDMLIRKIRLDEAQRERSRKWKEDKERRLLAELQKKYPK